MKSIGRPPRPKFLWLGLLIAFPAVVLVLFGVIALRQDRLLVHEQAVEEARTVVSQAAQVSLLEALTPTPPNPSALPGAGTWPARPEEDPVFASAQREPGWVICFLDQHGALLYPKPGELPLPVPMAASMPLDPALRHTWDQAERAEAVGNLSEAISAYEGALAGALPEVLAAQANYRLGVLTARAGQGQKALTYFEKVRREFPRAIAETGVPLALYSGLHILELPNGNGGVAERNRSLLNEVCAQAVIRFPVLAPAILDEIEGEKSNDPRPIEAWRHVLAAHNEARHLAVAEHHIRNEQLRPERERLPHWIESDPDWLVLRIPSESNTWFTAISQTNLARSVRSALERAGIPIYLGVGVTVAGKPVLTPEGDELAAADLAPSETRPATRVSVRLVDPGLLYDRQRTRSVWFGSLIGVCALTMVMGLWAARVAFQRQRELTGLQTNFVSSVSHELRAPLASVRLMAEELNDLGESDAAKSRGYHQFIVQECRRLSALIENVLDFSRHEQGRQQYQFEPTDLGALIESTAKLMRTYAAEKQIGIVTHLPAESVEIEADGRALQQVLVNLIDNAIKHSPPVSTITVGLDDAEEAKGPAPQGRGSPMGLWRRLTSRRTREASLSCRRGVFIWVEDHGEGIPLDEQERIFERFYRPGSELRRETQGVGLGLAIVKYVAEAHGGRVSVRSEVGRGSRFTVELPMRNTSAEN